MKTKRRSKFSDSQSLIPETSSGQTIIDENTRTVKVQKKNHSSPKIIIDHSRDKLLDNKHITF